MLELDLGLNQADIFSDMVDDQFKDIEPFKFLGL